MSTDNSRGKVCPCGKEIVFNRIEKGTDPRAEGSSMDPLYKVFLCVGWYEGIGLWLWGVEWYLSTVATSSFKLFFVSFLFGRASKQSIVVFLFLPALDILHGQIFIFQSCSTSARSHDLLLSLSLITRMVPLYSACGSEFSR